MRIFGIQSDGKFVEFAHEPFQEDHTEKTLQDWLASNPEGILEDSELMIIGREVPTNLGGYIDLLGVDRAGNVVVVELKRAKTPRATVAQALEYAAFALRLDADQLETIHRDYNGGESLIFAEDHRKHFGLDESDAVAFNKDQRIVIVGQEIAPQIRQTAQFLNLKGVNVTCVEFAFFRAQGGGQLMSQEIVIGEESRRPVQVSSRSAPLVDEGTFLASLDDNGRADFSRLIEWSNKRSQRINWGTKGFASHVDFGDSSVSVFRVYPPKPGQQQVLIVTFNEMEKKSSLPDGVIHNLKEQAESTNLFTPRGTKDLQRYVDQRMSDEEMTTLLSVLDEIANAIRQHGPNR